MNEFKIDSQEAAQAFADAVIARIAVCLETRKAATIVLETLEKDGWDVVIKIDPRMKGAAS